MKKSAIVFLISVILSLFVGFLAGQKWNVLLPPKDLIYATASGQTVHESEVLPLIQNDLNQVEKNIYELKKKATEQLIRQKMHSAQESAPSQEPVGVSDSDLQKFLKERNLSSAKLSQNDLRQIRDNLKLQKSKEAERKHEDQRLSQSPIIYRIPLPAETKVSLANDQQLPHWGKAEAPVQIFYISNFHCAFCRDSEKKLQALKGKYKDQIQIHYRFYFQEPENSWVQSSVEAALCANDQNAFEKFRDQLLSQKEIQSHGELLLAAKAVQLNVELFDACLTGRKYKVLLENEIQQFKKIGRVQSPSFVINGRLRAGQLPLEDITAAVDAELP